MPDYFALSLIAGPFLSLAAFGFAGWYVFVATKREPARVAKR